MSRGLDETVVSELRSSVVAMETHSTLNIFVRIFVIEVFFFFKVMFRSFLGF